MMKRQFSVLLSNVPSTRDICDELGFHGSKAKNNLSDFAHKMRKAYTTRDGRPGTKLLNWNSITEQEELKMMAEAFLSEAKKEEFWSSLKGLGGDSRPSYSDKQYAFSSFSKGLVAKAD